ncbi:MAG TPA: bacillithiol biosynthesis cysteine-adding enzyme BshC [Terriglobales bacterium]|nr:bacillithiol biosynthesis cysteine-adding enzyme BshC [Terriglobales bacterium]
MYSECLPFTRIPHTTKLFLDFLYDFPRVQRFYAHPPQSLSWVNEQAAQVDYDSARRERVAAILDRQNRAFGASPKTLESIERFRRGAYVAVTGQQVGFLGGPLFSVLKALTAVRIAVQATQSGVPCVPVFWLATEDHDLEEVKPAVLQDSDGALHTLAIDTEGPQGASIAHIRVAEASAAVVQEAATLLADPEVAQWVKDAYKPGIPLGQAFGTLFARIFSDSGVVLLDAADPELHAIAAPVYMNAIREAGELDSALISRGRELHGAGYHEQVKVTESSTLLFGTADRARTPIQRANGGFVLGREKLELQELLSRITAKPEDFTPNVLLRPVVQDYLLPSIAYSGGPAEVAYFAQAGVVFERLLGHLTPVLPRFSATVVDARAKRILQRYGLGLADLFHGPDVLRQEIASRSLPDELQAKLDGAKRVVSEALENVVAPLTKLDPTLIRSAERASNKMQYQLDRLRRRAASAELRKNEIIERHAERLSTALFPHKDLQERVIAGVSLLGQQGVGVLETLQEAALSGCLDHQIIYLT